MNTIAMGSQKGGGKKGQIGGNIILNKPKVTHIPTSVYIPKKFELKNSDIKGAGLGVFAKEDIPAGVDLGAYKGRWISIDEYQKGGHDLAYAWEIKDDNDNITGYVDGKPVKESNYLRYLNHPFTQRQENVASSQVGGEIRYYTIKPIKKGTELMVNYGSAYGEKLTGHKHLLP